MVIKKKICLFLSFVQGLIEGKDPGRSLYERVTFPKHTWEVSVLASRKVEEGLQDCGVICHQSNGSYNSLTFDTGLNTCSFAKVVFFNYYFYTRTDL